MDELTKIVNSHSPAFLLRLGLDTLYNISHTNKRIYDIIQDNKFWYLKLEFDYQDYVNKWKDLKTTYLGKIVYQEIYQNSKDYYLFYYQYDQQLETIIPNSYDSLHHFFKILTSCKMQINHAIMFLSLTYDDITLEKRLKERNIDLFSSKAVIISIIPLNTNNYNILYSIFCCHKKLHYDKELLETYIHDIKPNLLALSNVYFMMTDSKHNFI